MEYSESKLLAGVAASMKGGPYYANPMKPRPMKFVEGWPESVRSKLKSTLIRQGKPTDPWANRFK